MSSNRGKKFIELLNKREKLEGTKIFRMLIHLATSQYTVNRNYHELSIAIGNYEKDLSIWDVKKRPRLNAFLRELSRLLQNYLSSIYSLIEHTKIFYTELNNSRLNEEYSLKLSTFQSNNCVRFVRDLRTYSQHIGLPFISAQVSFTKTNEKTGGGRIKQNIILEKKGLAKWKNWHRDSEKYIEAHKRIDLKVALTEYQFLTKDFYDWFYKKVLELYSKELEQYDKLEKEIAQLG